MDNAKFLTETNVFSTAAEYVFMRPDGKAVVITDEAFGFGAITYECEVGLTCPRTEELTTTTAVTTTTVDPNVAPFIGSWTSDTALAITIDLPGTVSIFDGTNFHSSAATFTEDNGVTSITFTDENGQTVTGVMATDGNTISFTNTATQNTLYSSWIKGIVDITTTVAPTTMAPTTLVPTTVAATTLIATTTTVATTTTTSIGSLTAVVTTVAATTVAVTTVQGAAGTGGIFGDPHVKVQIPGEEAVCFDITPTFDYIKLLQDDSNNLTVTGYVNHHDAKRRLESVGLKIEKLQIEVGAEYVTIDGISVGYTEDRVLRFNDVTVEMISHLRSRHRGCMIRLDTGAVFHVSSKDSKDSLKFEIISSEGMPSKIGGLLGVSIRPHEYHIDADGKISVLGNVISDATRVWNHHSYCHVLPASSIEQFLGTSVSAYALDGLFGEQNSPLSIIEDTSPK